jgi:hypothetical protein
MIEKEKRGSGGALMHYYNYKKMITRLTDIETQR